MKTTFVRGFVSSVALVAAAPAFAQTAKAPPQPAVAAPTAKLPAQQTSTEADRKAVSITVYNQNFGVVREVRELASLGTGQVALEFRDVAANIQPQTVAIKSLTAPGAISVLEQNYRYDLLTPQTLLEKFVGKKIRTYRYHEATGKEEAADAELLSVNDQQPILRLNGEVTFGYPARYAFSQVPDNLIAKPTLMWLVQSQKAQQTVEVSYLTQNLSWSADYVLVVNEQDTVGALQGWVTLVNQSGASYKNAELKLVAGDVNRVQPQRQYKSEGMAVPAAAPMGGAQFSEQGLFEYHMYTLGRPTTLLQNEQKQVSLLEADGIKIDKKLIFYGQQYWFRGQYGQIQSNQKVGVYLDFKNEEQNKLGIPLPKGTLRVYKADKSGAKQFVGEDQIDHTPRDEKLRVKMGEAFDVVGDRKQTEWRALGNCSSESSWEVELRNHKDTPVVVEDYEPIGGDWTVVESSIPYVKKDAGTFTFEVKVPARGKTKVTYKVRLRYC
ncbi:MAG: hypothetical protein K0R38_2336 [Polyangiaceae bacterium]|jgi:hypothetical protein|nr:hypothetical protein [Polyangiaceae bacterium]